MKTENSAVKLGSSKRKKEIFGEVARTVVVIIAALFVLVPIYIVLITSLTSNIEMQGNGFRWWPEGGITFKGYQKVFARKIAGTDLLLAFWNTLWMYIPSVVVGVFMSAMAAYAFGKMDFVLNKPMFAILMATLTLPNCIGTIAAFLMYDTIGWVNSPLPLMVPRMLGSIGVVFFLRQFYMGIPDDLLGSGRIDGLNEFGLFMRIALPLSLPAIGSQFILQFIGAYNDFMGPLLYIHNSAFYPLQLALSFFVEAYVQDWQLQMAGTFIAMAPLLVLYLLSQKFILKGVSITSGLKG